MHWNDTTKVDMHVDSELESVTLPRQYKVFGHKVCKMHCIYIYVVVFGALSY